MELLLSNDGRTLEAEYVESTILSEFREAGQLHPDLEAKYAKRNMTHGRNAIHWARAALTEDGITVDSKIAPMKYVLACRLENLINFYNEEELIDFEGFNTRKGARTQKQSFLKHSDSVYVINSASEPNWCKIGAGNGDCSERLAEAKRWTMGRARIIHLFRVGDGFGLKVEAASHQILRKKAERQLEWFKCSPKMASECIREGAKRVKVLSLRESGHQELDRIERKAKAELKATG